MIVTMSPAVRTPFSTPIAEEMRISSIVGPEVLSIVRLSGALAEAVLPAASDRLAETAIVSPSNAPSFAW